jgi:hypothetical protein
MEWSVKIYYARPRELMGTKQDRENLKRLDKMYPGAVIQIVSAKECREDARKAKSMEPFLKMVDGADLVAIASFDDVSVTAGVFSEAQHALHAKKPVLALMPAGARLITSLHPLKDAGKENRHSQNWARMVFS